MNCTEKNTKYFDENQNQNQILICILTNLYLIREFLYFLVAMHLLHSHKTIKVASCLFFRALSPIRLLFELLSLPEFMEHSPQLLSRKYRVAQYTVNPLENKSSKTHSWDQNHQNIWWSTNFFMKFCLLYLFAWSKVGLIKKILKILLRKGCVISI